MLDRSTSYPAMRKRNANNNSNPIFLAKLLFVVSSMEILGPLRNFFNLRTRAGSFIPLKPFAIRIHSDDSKRESAILCLNLLSSSLLKIEDHLQVDLK